MRGDTKVEVGVEAKGANLRYPKDPVVYSVIRRLHSVPTTTKWTSVCVALEGDPAKDIAENR